PVVNFIEQPFGAPAVTRTLAVTPHLDPAGAVPDYAFYYDGTASGNPRVVVQIAINTTPSTLSFDLGVTTSAATSPGAGFDLAGLSSVDQNGNPNVLTGIHNVVVGGDVLLNLNASSPGAGSFFTGIHRSLPNTTGGVQLPNDIVAVAAAGN